MARLAEIPGLEHAATDHSGTYLRIRARDLDVVASARAAVRTLDHDTDELPADETRALLSSATGWYDRARLHELSREEAGVLAEDVTSAFERQSALTGAERERLRSDVADALMISLTDEDGVPGTRAERAVPLILERAASYLGEERTPRLRSVLRSWSDALPRR
ncbi:MAG: hypothetical protein ACRDY6_08780 [Acidimicrobiia bacterium]